MGFQPPTVPTNQAPEHVLNSAGVTLGPEALKGNPSLQMVGEGCEGGTPKLTKKNNGGFRDGLTQLFGMFFFVWGRTSIVRFFFEGLECVFS